MGEQEYTSGTRDVKWLTRSQRTIGQERGRMRLQWTPRTAIIALIISFVFSLAFLRLILAIIFSTNTIQR